MSEFVNPIPEPAWADSEHFERTFLMWQVSEHLGVLVIDENDCEEPVIIFLPFIDNPERAFWEGQDARAAGVTLSRLKDVVARLEAKLAASHPFEGD